MKKKEEKKKFFQLKKISFFFSSIFGTCKKKIIIKNHHLHHHRQRKNCSKYHIMLKQLQSGKNGTNYGMHYKRYNPNNHQLYQSIPILIGNKNNDKND